MPSVRTRTAAPESRAPARLLLTHPATYIVHVSLSGLRVLVAALLNLLYWVWLRTGCFWADRGPAPLSRSPQPQPQLPQPPQLQQPEEHPAAAADGDRTDSDGTVREPAAASRLLLSSLAAKTASEMMWPFQPDEDAVVGGAIGCDLDGKSRRKRQGGDGRRTAWVVRPVGDEGGRGGKGPEGSRSAECIDSLPPSGASRDDLSDTDPPTPLMNLLRTLMNSVCGVTAPTTATSAISSSSSAPPSSSSVPAPASFSTAHHLATPLPKSPAAPAAPHLRRRYTSRLRKCVLRIHIPGADPEQLPADWQEAVLGHFNDSRSGGAGRSKRGSPCSSLACKDAAICKRGDQGSCAIRCGAPSYLATGVAVRRGSIYMTVSLVQVPGQAGEVEGAVAAGEEGDGDLVGQPVEDEGAAAAGAATAAAGVGTGALKQHEEVEVECESMEGRLEELAVAGWPGGTCRGSAASGAGSGSYTGHPHRQQQGRSGRQLLHHYYHHRRHHYQQQQHRHQDDMWISASPLSTSSGTGTHTPFQAHDTLTLSPTAADAAVHLHPSSTTTAPFSSSEPSQSLPTATQPHPHPHPHSAQATFLPSPSPATTASAGPGSAYFPAPGFLHANRRRIANVWRFDHMALRAPSSSPASVTPSNSNTPLPAVGQHPCHWGQSSSGSLPVLTGAAVAAMHVSGPCRSGSSGVGIAPQLHHRMRYTPMLSPVQHSYLCSSPGPCSSGTGNTGGAAGIVGGATGLFLSPPPNWPAGPWRPCSYDLPPRGSNTTTGTATRNAAATATGGGGQGGGSGPSPLQVVQLLGGMQRCSREQSASREARHGCGAALSAASPMEGVGAIPPHVRQLLVQESWEAEEGGGPASSWETEGVSYERPLPPTLPPPHVMMMPSEDIPGMLAPQLPQRAERMAPGLRVAAAAPVPYTVGGRMGLGGRGGGVGVGGPGALSASPLGPGGSIMAGFSGAGPWAPASAGLWPSHTASVGMVPTDPASSPVRKVSVRPVLICKAPLAYPEAAGPLAASIPPAVTPSPSGPPLPPTLHQEQQQLHPTQGPAAATAAMPPPPVITPLISRNAVARATVSSSTDADASDVATDAVAGATATPATPSAAAVSFAAGLSPPTELHLSLLCAPATVSQLSVMLRYCSPGSVFSEQTYLPVQLQLDAASPAVAAAIRLQAAAAADRERRGGGGGDTHAARDVAEAAHAPLPGEATVRTVLSGLLSPGVLYVELWLGPQLCACLPVLLLPESAATWAHEVPLLWQQRAEEGEAAAAVAAGAGASDPASAAASITAAAAHQVVEDLGGWLTYSAHWRYRTEHAMAAAATAAHAATAAAATLASAPWSSSCPSLLALGAAGGASSVMGSSLFVSHFPSPACVGAAQLGPPPHLIAVADTSPQQLQEDLPLTWVWDPPGTGALATGPTGSVALNSLSPAVGPNDFASANHAMETHSSVHVHSPPVNPSLLSQPLTSPPQQPLPLQQQPQPQHQHSSVMFMAHNDSYNTSPSAVAANDHCNRDLFHDMMLQEGYNWLADAVEAGCCGLAAVLMDSLLAVGCTAAEVLRTCRSADGLSLMHAATLSSNGSMVRLVASWGRACMADMGWSIGDDGTAAACNGMVATAAAGEYGKMCSEAEEVAAVRDGEVNVGGYGRVLAAVPAAHVFGDANSTAVVAAAAAAVSSATATTAALAAVPGCGSSCMVARGPATEEERKDAVCPRGYVIDPEPDTGSAGNGGGGGGTNHQTSQCVLLQAAQQADAGSSPRAVLDCVAMWIPAIAAISMSTSATAAASAYNILRRQVSTVGVRFGSGWWWRQDSRVFRGMYNRLDRLVSSWPGGLLVVVIVAGMVCAASTRVMQLRAGYTLAAAGVAVVVASNAAATAEAPWRCSLVLLQRRMVPAMRDAIAMVASSVPRGTCIRSATLAACRHGDRLLNGLHTLLIRLSVCDGLQGGEAEARFLKHFQQCHGPVFSAWCWSMIPMAGILAARYVAARDWGRLVLTPLWMWMYVLCAVADLTGDTAAYRSRTEALAAAMHLSHTAAKALTVLGLPAYPLPPGRLYWMDVLACATLSSLCEPVRICVALPLRLINFAVSSVLYRVTGTAPTMLEALLLSGSCHCFGLMLQHALEGHYRRQFATAIAAAAAAAVTAPGAGAATGSTGGKGTARYYQKREGIQDVPQLMRDGGSNNSSLSMLRVSLQLIEKPSLAGEVPAEMLAMLPTLPPALSLVRSSFESVGRREVSMPPSGGNGGAVEAVAVGADGSVTMLETWRHRAETAQEGVDSNDRISSTRISNVGGSAGGGDDASPAGFGLAGSVPGVTLGSIMEGGMGCDGVGIRLLSEDSARLVDDDEQGLEGGGCMPGTGTVWGSTVYGEEEAAMSWPSWLPSEGGTSPQVAPTSLSSSQAPQSAASAGPQALLVTLTESQEQGQGQAPPCYVCRQGQDAAQQHQGLRREEVEVAAAEEEEELREVGLSRLVAPQLALREGVQKATEASGVYEAARGESPQQRPRVSWPAAAVAAGCNIHDIVRCVGGEVDISRPQQGRAAEAWAPDAATTAAAVVNSPADFRPHLPTLMPVMPPPPPAALQRPQLPAALTVATLVTARCADAGVSPLTDPGAFVALHGALSSGTSSGSGSGSGSSSGSGRRVDGNGRSSGSGPRQWALRASGWLASALRRRSGSSSRGTSGRGSSGSRRRQQG